MRLEIEADIYLTTKQEKRIEKCKGDQALLRRTAQAILQEGCDSEVQGVQVFPS